MHKGSCLCQSITFEVKGDLPQPTACHCTQCRKHSGHYEASADIPRANVSIHGTEHITWYRTENVRRGFCKTCGSSLFWDPPPERDWIGIAMGAFDPPTDTKIRIHIHVASKSDYYELADGLPQNQQ